MMQKQSSDNPESQFLWYNKIIPGLIKNVNKIS